MADPAQLERHPEPGEHRWGERVALPMAVILDAGGRVTGPGTLRVVSISGAFIETALALPVFTNLAVRLDSRELAACVVRREPQGVAVEWRDMACPTLLALLRQAGVQPTERTAPDHAFS